MKEKIPESSKTMQKEFKSSLEFLKDLLIFGGFILAFLFNLFYIAVEKDFAIQDSYLVIKHRDIMSEQEILQAIATLKAHCFPTRQNAKRLSLCSDDLELIYLEKQAQGEVLIKVRELLRQKFMVDKEWEKVFVNKFSRAKTPFNVPRIERFILYYSWAIEILAIVLLSQTIQKKHIQHYIFQCAHKIRYFFPIVGITLFIPCIQFIYLTMSNMYGFWWLLLISFCITIAATAFLFILVLRTLNKEKEITELGLYIFISTIFMQLLAISGDIDMVYDTFSNPAMPYGRYASWFIIAILPIFLIQKMIMTKNGSTEK